MGSRMTARLAEPDRELKRRMLNPEKAERRKSSNKSSG